MRLVNLLTLLTLAGLVQSVGAQKAVQNKVARPPIVLPAAEPAPVILPPQPHQPPAPALNSDDEKTLRDMRLPTDSAALLDYFKSRTHAEANPKQMAELIGLLGHPSFQVRERAYAQIMNLGSSALVALKQAERHPDLETLRRVLDLRRRIEEKANPLVQSAAVRLLAKANPPGTVEVLLNYLPFASDASVIDEIGRSLTRLAQVDGKPHPALVAALKDKIAVKRGIAAEALAPLAGVRAEVAILLTDADPKVRLRAGLALVNARYKEAVPTLIEVMSELPPDDLWPAEELLVRLAGEKTPSVSLGLDEPSRKECRRVWEAWWNTNKESVDLAKLGEEPKLLGYTLIVQQTFNRVVGGRVQRGGGEVLELDQNRKERWKIPVESTYPVDAQIVGNDRVLITEYNGQRVTERDKKGTIVWEYRCNNNPISAQRLPNGNTFIAMQNQLIEIDRNKGQVWSILRTQYDVFRARLLRNGEVAIITNQGQYVRMNPRTQRETASFHVGQLGNLFGNFEVLPNGNVLVPLYQQHMVIEYNPQGKEVWRAPVQLPTSAQRLPNGNTLIASMNTRRVIEVNPQGQEVWSHNVEGQVFNARRR